MRHFVRVVATLVWLTGCGPAASPLTSSQPTSIPAAAPTSVSNVAPASAAGAQTTSAIPEPNLQLDELVARAKQEGLIAISAPTAEVWRRALTSFHDDYPDIQVEYTGADSRDFWPKLAQERNGGQYLVDVRIGGPDPQVFDAITSGTLDPVRPLLFLPDVQDESRWLGGWNAFYADRAKQYLPGFLSSSSRTVYINTAQVSPGELKTEQDLLDPRWKGKILLQDPRGGAGLAILTTFLQVDGEPFVRSFLAQNPVISGDNRQIAEWLVRGRYPIAVGVRSSDLLQFFQQGLGKEVKPVDGLRAQSISIGSGGIQLINRAPHPNATRLFVNWLLTQRTQQRVTEIVQDNSLRVDVPPGDPHTKPDPGKMGTYVAHQTEELLPVRRQAQQIAAELLK